MRKFLREFFAPFFEAVCIAPLAAAEFREAKEIEKQKRHWPAKAGIAHYLCPANKSQVAIIVRALAGGRYLTTLDLKRRVEQGGHEAVNDIGHRISEARAVFWRADIILISKSLKLASGKKCHEHHVALSDLEKLAQLAAEASL